jgi:NTE family protein
MLAIKCTFPGIRTVLMAVIMYILSCGIALAGESDQENPDTKRPEVGVVFSGGGAKGLAHIGVLKVLEEVNMPVDYITGTSMGALVGGLYAIGYSPEFMQDLVLGLNWNELFSDEVKRIHMPMEEKYWDGQYLITLPFSQGRLRLPAGLVAGQHISMLLSGLTWDYLQHTSYSDLPIPFACVATDLENGDAHVMNEGILAQSIRASISIPTVFTPVTIDGRTVVDGGVVRNLPVSDVKNMGADIVIGINVSEGLKYADSLRTLIDIMDQTVGFKMYQSVSEEAKLADLLIEPDVKNVGILDFQMAMEIVNLGEMAAREHYDWLKNLADSLNAIEPYNRRPELTANYSRAVDIADIRIGGLEYYSAGQLKNQIQMEIGTRTNPAALNNVIERLHSLQYFHRITYSLQPAEDEAYILNVSVVEREQSTFRFGFRYDNYTNANLLFNSTLKNLVTRGSTLRLTASLGLEPVLDAQLIRYVGSGNTIGFQGRMNYELKKFDLYDDKGIRTSSFDNNSIYAELMFFPVASSRFLIGGGVREEFYSASSGIGFLDLDQAWSNLHLITGLIWYDNLDKTFFPHSGHSVRLNGLRSFPIGNNGESFWRAELIWRSYYSLSETLTFTTRGHFGFIEGNQIPVHHNFFMAGDRGFAGLKRYEVNGTEMKWSQVGLRYEFVESTYAELLLNTGNAKPIFDRGILGQKYNWGWGLSLGMETIIAPVQLVFSGGDRHNLLISFAIGFTF